MKMSEKRKDECVPTGSKKHRFHKFTVVETKMAVLRHSRTDESSLRPQADQLVVCLQSKAYGNETKSWQYASSLQPVGKVISGIISELAFSPL